MFDTIEPPATTPAGSVADTWNSMNSIQQVGVGGSILLYFASMVVSSANFNAGVIVGICALSCLLLGYVASALWKARHALHFWYSIAFACIVHACFLPLYAWLMRMQLQPDIKRGTGKVLLLSSVALVAAETYFLVGLLKRIALLLFKRRLHSNPYNRGTFPGK